MSLWEEHQVPVNDEAGWSLEQVRVLCGLHIFAACVLQTVTGGLKVTVRRLRCVTNALQDL